MTAGVGSLLASVFMLMVGLGLLHTSVALRLQAALDSPLLVGFAMSAYFAGLTIGSLRIANVIQRVGHIRAFASLGAILAASTICHTILPEGLSWIALRFVQGFSMAGLFMCVESWLNQKASNRGRGTLLAVYMVTVYGGMGGGQLLLTTATPGSGVLISVSALLITLAVVPVALMRAESPIFPEWTPLNIAKLYAISPLGVVLTFSSGLIMGAILGVGPLFAHAAGLSLSAISLFMTALMLGGVALQFPIGRLSDRLDRRHVIAALTAGLAVVSVLLTQLIGVSAAALIVASIALGGIAFTLYPLAAAHINDFIDQDAMVAASSAIILIYSVGATLGPLASAKLVSLWGAPGFLVFLALVGVATAGFALWRISAGTKMPMEAQGPYVAVPRTSPVANVLDPRAAPTDETAEA